MKIEHIALWVKDLERMKRFYQECFDGEAGEMYTNPRTGFRSYFIKFSSGARLEIMNQPELGDGADVNHNPPTGYAHLAFGVGSRTGVDELTGRLREQGYPVVSGPRTTGDGYYESCVLDPEGNRVEITI